MGRRSRTSERAGAASGASADCDVAVGVGAGIRNSKVRSKSLRSHSKSLKVTRKVTDSALLSFDVVRCRSLSFVVVRCFVASLLRCLVAS